MTIETIEQALAALGVTDQTLSEAERRSLDELGYVVFPAVIPPAQVASMREAYDQPQPFTMRNDRQMLDEPGGRRHTNMEHMSPAFDGAYTHPKHLAAVHHILRCRFMLFTINGRDPGEGFGHQQIHRDASRQADRRTRAVQSLWMLDEFDAENGATRIVPGTHFQDERYEDLPADRDAPHPRQIQLLAPAGSIAVFNSHLMHGGTINRTPRHRRTLHSTFVPWYAQVKEWSHQQWITLEMYDRISPAARFLLDVQRPG